MSEPFWNRKLYTSGDVARVIGVSARCVNKWIEGGHLKGFRIPGSDHRRVARADLLAFLESKGLPTDSLRDPGPGLVLLVGCTLRFAAEFGAALPADLVSAACDPGAEALPRASRDRPCCVAINLAAVGPGSPDLASRCRRLAVGYSPVLVALRESPPHAPDPAFDDWAPASSGLVAAPAVAAAVRAAAAAPKRVGKSPGRPKKGSTNGRT